MKRLTTLWIALALVIFTGCKDSPVQVQEDDTLTAELTLSTDHVHTLSELTYTVKITDANGNTVTDMDTVEVQRKAHGSDTWRGTELTLSGTTYEGTYTFNSSGEYDIRVAGVRKGDTKMEVLYNMDEHLNVGRAHTESGNYRIEYENFPGHVHDGETATAKFWIMEKDEDASGERPAVTGLDADVHCTDPNGASEVHQSVTEENSGVYKADHTFMGGGEAHMEIQFTDSNGNPIEADFHFHVSHGH